MEASQRGALMLVRFVAAALIGWTLVEITLYVMIAHHNNAPVEVMPCIIRSLPMIAGVAMLVKAKRLAEWIAETLDL
jgi:hypothetical protein